MEKQINRNLSVERKSKRNRVFVDHFTYTWKTIEVEDVNWFYNQCIAREELLRCLAMKHYKQICRFETGFGGLSISHKLVKHNHLGFALQWKIEEQSNLHLPLGGKVLAENWQHIMQKELSIQQELRSLFEV